MRNPSEPIVSSAAPAWVCGLLLALAAAAVGCGSPVTPGNDRPQAAEKWFRRAQQDLQTCDLDEARDSAQKALSIVPEDEEVRVLAARIALGRLDYGEVERLLKGMHGSEAAGLRGRALWYKGDLDAAADDLESMLNDPEVVDEWAKSIAKLARQGAGRQPFALSGGLLAAVEIPHVSPVADFFVVPLEIDGESALALVSTGNAEVVLDAGARKDPSWVSLRFGERLEVHDVPALAQDLSGISKQLGTPIRALLGVNLLRHLNVTLDYGGRQFVARTFTPPAPPHATRVDLCYVRGGGMVLRSSLAADKTTSRAALLVDTAMTFPVALDKEGWKKAGVDDATKLKPVPEDPEGKLREGVVSVLRLGAFEVPKVPGVFGAPVEQIEKALTSNIDGVIGAGLLSHFRITFGDGGRLMWLEDDTAVQMMLQQAEAQAGAAAPPLAAPGPLAPALGGPEDMIEPPLPPLDDKAPGAGAADKKPAKKPGKAPAGGGTKPSPKK